MRIRGEAQPGFVVLHVPPPHRGPAQEEALVIGQPARHRIGFACRRGLHGVIGCRKASQISDILVQRQLAIHVFAKRLVTAKLLDELARALRKCLGIGWRPPVFELAGSVKARPLIIVAVRHLVTDHGADASVIGRVIGIGIEKRRLKDGCRKHNVVAGCTVVGIDNLRPRVPFIPFDRLADLAQCPLVVEFLQRLQIVVVAVATGAQPVP